MMIDVRPCSSSRRRFWIKRSLKVSSADAGGGSRGSASTLALGTPARTGFVEHQDRRVLQDCPGDGDALLLASTESLSSFSCGANAGISCTSFLSRCSAVRDPPTIVSYCCRDGSAESAYQSRKTREVKGRTSGKDMILSWIAAALAASTTSSIVMRSLPRPSRSSRLIPPYAMFIRADELNRTDSCGTRPILARRERCVKSRMSWPLMLTDPLETS